MTKEEKQLLLKDLCGRLPYKTNIFYDNHGTTEVREFGLGGLHDFMFDNAEVKPYLRPMSSMSENERKEIDFYRQEHNYEVRARKPTDFSRGMNRTFNNKRILTLDNKFSYIFID